MRCLRFALAFTLLATPVALLAIDPAVATPPTARRVPHKLDRHGETRVDDFFWIKDKTNKEVIKYLEDENAYTAAVLKPLEKFQEKLYKEFLSRIKQTDQDAPVRDRGYWYYSRTVEGKQYPIHCRKKGSTDAPEEVLLDGNEMAKGEKFFSLGERRVSDDGRLLVFAADITGFREYTLSVKDLRTGKLIEDKLVKAPMFEWAADNKTLFYTTEDDAKRAHRVWRHTLGQPKEKDDLIYEEKDELFWLELAKSRDGKYLFLSSVSYGSTEARYLPTDKPAGMWTMILKREANHEYDADHGDGKFYIRTNKNAKNFKVVTCPVENTGPSNWTDLAPYDPRVHIEGVSCFNGHTVLSVRINALPQLIVRDIKTGNSHTVAFNSKAYDVRLSHNPEFDSTAIRFTYSSLTEPDIEYSYDLNTRDRKQVKVKEAPGGYSSNDYVIDRVLAVSQDGTKVPISLVYKKGLKRDGTAPCLLTGYGAYGLNLPMEFHAVRVSLLDRGVVYAIAHIRGGSDMGRTWYDDGKMLKKL